MLILEMFKSVSSLHNAWIYKQALSGIFFLTAS